MRACPLRLVVLLALTAACEPTPPEGPFPLWSADARSVDNPLPDDRLLSDGHVELPDGWFEAYLPDDAATHEAYALFEGYAEHYRELEGFGALASGFVRFSAPLDVEAAPGGLSRSLKLVDLGALREVPSTVTLPSHRGWARIAPTGPLAPNVRHAVVVLEGLSSGGAPLVPSADTFRAARAGTLAGLDEVTAALDVEPEQVLLVSSFTPYDPTVELVAAAAVLAGEVPEHSFDAPAEGRARGVFSRAEAISLFPEFEYHLAAAGLLAIGTLSAVNARDEAGVLDPALLADGVVENVEMVLIEPDPAVHPPPWPCVVAQHGFSGSNRFAFSVARELNERGLAVLAIDAVSHGSRGAVVSFFNVEDVRVARDNFRQSALDLVQLAELARLGVIDVDGVAGPDLSGEVHYFGHSMGAIIGTLFAAVATEPTTVVLNAAGGGLTNIFESPSLKSAISLLTLPALGLSYDDPVYDDVLPFLAGVTQGLLDPGDPMHYGRLLLRERAAHTPVAPNFLFVLGVGDRLVPDSATEALVEAAGISFVTEAQSDDDGVNAAWRVVLSEFGIPEEQDPHGNFFVIQGVRIQTAEYIASGGTVLKDPKAP